MPIRAVLFDLGNTLVAYYQSHEFQPILERCLQGVAAGLGLTLTPDEERAMFQRAMEINRERRDLAVRPLAGRLQKLFGPYRDLQGAELASASHTFLDPIFARARLDADAWRVLEALRARKIKTCIVSNTPWGSPAEAWRDELTRHGLRERVDGDVFCMDVGWRKPHTAPFVRALEIAGVASDEAIFVGDDPRWDIVGAEAAGVCPILISPTGSHGAASCRTISQLPELLDLLDLLDD